ncbi:RNA polymerase sigma factor [Xanthomonas oryzae]|uniref:RNA polymerase sigma factor n=1 Tax=Xanthomonas oryzae TaxID=347 RepID=UPI00040CB52A|nr:sigma-70 family RNA polymerase sigma factor [Xanthomonas oryzae]ALS95353.1 RNA polymerase subunit sigma-70 [Xanthomonas oryzae pv. oryzae]AUI90115.1 RNA polymerase subunit sigma-70 [Xanthomonas oryzae pv. oryzae]AUI93795.1 RNA polymerase subunit sigma-70 [Xanthomonas oryzae pv. oryzae]AUI97464.1 RNA polymerase subunit sigma-70 [Xanthomonas oryzae pv. oryzae]AUJ01139.1 RNA polymerase subunit sigma-70 [Xanthomonas oryzae pv. oryzae]
MPLDTNLQTHFSSLLQQHRGIVLKVAASYCHDRDNRAELTQEIATHLWRAFPGYDPGRRFSTWMYRIALNVAISHLRGRRATGEPIALDAVMERIADSQAHDPVRAQQVAARYAFIAHQPPLEGALLLLYLDEHSYREIGEVLGISETHVATKLSRLKTRIRAKL